MTTPTIASVPSLKATCTKEQLLAEIEDLLRTVPQGSLHAPTTENFSWLGRVAAVIGSWNMSKGIPLGVYISQIREARNDPPIRSGTFGIMTLLHEARASLRMATLGPTNSAIGQGQVFDYFDEVRKLIEAAAQEILFVDPYLDAEFVSRYLPNLKTSILVRLLTREKLRTLLPAVDAFVAQNNIKVEVRSAPNFHDRYVIVDRNACYQSGASFKDGAKTAPTTLTQITDAFSVVLQTYESIWTSAKVER